MVSLPPISVFLLSALLAAAAPPGLPPAAQGEADFARDVHPILNARCAACHTGDKGQGGLSLSTRDAILKGGVSGPSIVPGKSAESLLIQRVAGMKPPLMPMGGSPLSPAEIGILRAWIDAGARMALTVPVSRWTAPMEPRRPAVPAAAGNPVDAFLDVYFQKQGIRAQQVVSDAAFLRRAYLDLWGLLPTPEQRASFLADSRPGKRERLITELLANRRNYSEHWISFWNDLLHNDEGVTYIGDRKSITKWLMNALSTNMPYNRMAAALLNPESADNEGFIMGVNWRGDINASQTPVMQAAQNSAQVFLGVNLKCNSCHDSFISSWKLKDAYGLASFFSKDPLEIARCDVKTGKFSSPAFLYPQLGGVSAEATLEERRRAAAELFTKRENGRFARTIVNRLWERLLGRGLVEPVDDMDAEPWNPDLLDWLASDFADHDYDLQHLLTRIMTSRAYQLPAAASEPREKSFVFRGPRYRRLSAEQFADAVSSVSTEWRVLGSTKAGPGVYARDWRFKSNSLARALGRPTRDLAVTERNNDPTMLQMLELVNGPTLANTVRRGAQRLLGELPPAPQAAFDSGVVGSGKVSVDVDLTGARELRLLIRDYDSYDPSRVVAGWASAVLEGPKGSVALSSLVPKQGAASAASLQIKNDTKREALIGAVPSEIVYDLAGSGFTRFRAAAGVDQASLISEINPKIRFYVFLQEPDRDQLSGVTGQPPVAVPQEKFTPNSLISRVFLHTLGRQPTEAERQVAREFLLPSGKSGRPSAEGLEDLLWSIFVTPEFQYIR